MLGQTVSVNPATIYENVSGIGAITGGNCAYAEVYAFYDATTSSYNATRVECKTTQPDTYRLYGPIGNLTGSTFTINGLTVTYTGVSELPTLSNGVVVRVRLSKTLEKMCTERVRDARTAVNHRDTRGRQVSRKGEIHLAGIWRELDSIRD